MRSDYWFNYFEPIWIKNIYETNENFAIDTKQK